MPVDEATVIRQANTALEHLQGIREDIGFHAVQEVFTAYVAAAFVEFSRQMGPILGAALIQHIAIQTTNGAIKQMLKGSNQ